MYYNQNNFKSLIICSLLSGGIIVSCLSSIILSSSFCSLFLVLLVIPSAILLPIKSPIASALLGNTFLPAILAKSLPAFKLLSNIFLPYFFFHGFTNIKYFSTIFISYISSKIHKSLSLNISPIMWF